MIVVGRKTLECIRAACISPGYRASIRTMTRWLIMFALGLAFSSSAPDFVRVSRDRNGFVLSGSGSRFRPWGFNYDHDPANRLLETYWDKEWRSVVEDF